MRRAGVRRLLSAPGLCYQCAPRTPYVRHPISGQSRHQQQHQQQQQLCTATRPAAFSASGTHPRAPPAAEEADLLFGYLPRESLPTSSLTNTGMSYTVREQREQREGLLRASVCACVNGGLPIQPGPILHIHPLAQTPSCPLFVAQRNASTLVRLPPPSQATSPSCCAHTVSLLPFPARPVQNPDEMGIQHRKAHGKPKGGVKTRFPSQPIPPSHIHTHTRSLSFSLSHAPTHSLFPA